MELPSIKLFDRAQDVFINAEEIDEQTVRLSISDAINDSSTELSIEREKLVEWCRSLINTFDSSR